MPVTGSGIPKGRATSGARPSGRAARRRAVRRTGTDGSWPRRIGIALGLIVVGGTIVLAGSGALDPTPRPGASPSTADPASSGGPSVSVEPRAVIAAPVVDGVGAVLTRERTWQLTVTVPADLEVRRQTRLVVYRGENVVVEVPVARVAVQIVPDIPLRRGENLLTVALRGPAGEGDRSPTVVVTRDDTAPDLAVEEPLPDAEVNAERVSVTGRTEPGAEVRITNDTTGRTGPAAVAANGAFAAELVLDVGENTVTVVATDAAGNVASSRFTVVRGEGEPEARLTLSQNRFPVRTLPGSISLRVVVVDEEGLPVDGAQAVFSLSPPGLPTTTFRTVTVRGEASWLDVSLPRDGAVPGEGFATVRVSLADGSVVDVLAPFAFH